MKFEKYNISKAIKKNLEQFGFRRTTALKS